ncbi:MAG: hypothetical protein SGJ09_02630 [Phycisphaerae bacterium]|nr:hypothetical protein [Phycisphaerae bacterium]
MPKKAASAKSPLRAANPSGPQLVDRKPPTTKRESGGPPAKHEWKGGPEGAHQGGASRGSSRLEPSHSNDAARKDQAKKPSKAAKR